MEALRTAPLAATLLALSLSPSPCPRAGEGPELRYAPSADVLRQHEHFVQHLLTTRVMRFRVGDSEQLSHSGFDVATRLDLLATDQVLEPAPGRPARFRRAFERARLAIDLELLEVEGAAPRPLKTSSTGGFEGKSVVFTWIEDEQEYGRYYDALEGVEEDLARVLPDLDLTGFLPPGEVEPGSTWQVDPLELRGVLGPGGYLGFDLSGIGDPQLSRTLRGGLGTHMYEAFGEHLDGELEATYRGLREVGGRELAAIELRFDVRVGAELTELMNRARTGGEIDAGLEIDSFRIDLELAGEGEILWDLAGSHLAQARFSGSEAVRARTRILAPGSPSLEQEIDLAGSFKNETHVRTQPVPAAAPAPAPGATDRR